MEALIKEGIELNQHYVFKVLAVNIKLTLHRHSIKTGKKIKFTDWGTTMQYWAQWRDNINVINVLDKKVKKGF